MTKPFDQQVATMNELADQDTKNMIDATATDKETSLNKQTKASEQTDELSSDGSASAFEGTESIDSTETDADLKRQAEKLKNDPSGRSDY